MSGSASHRAGHASARLAVVAAGGTGGHLFPAEALARALAARGWRLVLATDVRGSQYAQDFPAEERLALEAATFRRGDVLGMARASVRIGAGVAQAMRAFRRLRPAVVVGFGGYPSLPALVASRLGSIPTVIHEQNAVLGRANRHLAPHVGTVACAFPALGRAGPKVTRAHRVGNPVRPQIAALYDAPYVAPTDTVRILVTGGSQGAQFLSSALPRAVALMSEDLRTRLRVEQQTRVDAIEPARRVFAEAGVEAEVAPFFRDMAGRLSRAHLVVGRAGASTISEIAVAGRPSVLIPLATAADDHQRANALVLGAVGAAQVLDERDLTVRRLAETLEAMIADPAGLVRAATAARATALPHAAERLADLVEAAAR